MSKVKSNLSNYSNTSNLQTGLNIMIHNTKDIFTVKLLGLFNGNPTGFQKKNIKNMRDARTV